jgi:hypothetical protein
LGAGALTTNEHVVILFMPRKNCPPRRGLAYVRAASLDLLIARGVSTLRSEIEIALGLGSIGSGQIEPT